MGLFKTEYCAICGKKAGLSGATLKMDDSKICFDCFNKVALNLRSCLENNWDIEDLKKYFEYREKEKDIIRSLEGKELEYRKPLPYLYLNDEHELLSAMSWLDKMGDESVDVFEYSNIASIDFSFVPHTYKEGMLGNNIIGNLFMILTLRDPNLNLHFLVDKKRKQNAFMNSAIFFNQMVLHERLEDVEILRASLMRTFMLARERKEMQENANDVSGLVKKKRARNMLLFDETEPLSREKIDTVWKRMVSAYQNSSLQDERILIERLNDARDTLLNEVH